MVALADACDSGKVPGQVVVVVADRDCRGLEVAQARGLPTVLQSPNDFETRDEWSRVLAESVGEFRPDLVVSAGFMRILSPDFVDAFAGRLINLHPALLPSFPGAHGVRDALQHGVKVTGSTIHFIDYEVDHGPIILQEAVTVLEDDTESSLHERIKSVEHRLLPEACRLFLEGRVGVKDGRVQLLEPQGAR
jgi:phosphoribosylglycinamide formyltransferase-1